MKKKEQSLKALLYRRVFVNLSMLLLATTLLVACGTAKRVTEPIVTTVPEPDTSLTTLEVDTVSISFDNLFTDGNGAFSYSIESNSNSSVVVPSIAEGKFKMQLKGAGSSEIVFRETTAANTALASLTVKVTESATAGQSADVQLIVGSNFLANSTAGFSYALTKNTNASVLSPQIKDNALTLDFLGEGSATITIDETGPDGTIRPATFTVSGSQGETDFPRIEFTSDRSMVFSEPGQTGQLSAVVYGEDGKLIPDAQINWTSSRPEMVEVNSSGVITTKVPVGSATITASFGRLRTTATGDIPEETATIVVGRLATNTKLIESSDVISTDSRTFEVILRKTETTSAVQVGDIIVSGARGNIFAKVVSISSNDSQVLVLTEAVNVNEAFTDADIDVFGATRSFEFVVEENIVSLVDEATGLSVQQFVPSQFKCKAGLTAVNVNFTGASFKMPLEFKPKFKYKEVNDRVELIEVSVEGSIALKATTGKAKLSTKANIECKITLTSIKFATLPILGPIIFAPQGAPEFGVTLETEFTGAELDIPGPKLDKGISLTAGFGWNRDEGFYIINEGPSETGSGFTLFSDYQGDFTIKVKTKIEPFVALKFQAAILFGLFDVIHFDFVRLKAFGGIAAEWGPPFDDKELGFVGPQLETYVGFSGDLKPLIEQAQFSLRAMEKFGIPGTISQLTALDIKLFEVKRPFLKSALPTITSSTTVINEENPSATLTVSVPQISIIGISGTPVQIYAFKNGSTDPPDLIDGETVIVDGEAIVTWTPAQPATGTETYKVSAVVTDILTLLHGTKTPVTITVGDSEPPPPPPPPPPPGPEPQCEEEEEDGQNSCANSWGDPHLTTFDELDYDFQAVGDYILTKAIDPSDDFEIQIRYRKSSRGSDISYGNALAMNVAGDIVELYLDSSANLKLVLNGQNLALNTDTQALIGGGLVELDSLQGKIIWPDRTTLSVESVNSSVHGVFLNVFLSMPNSRKNKLAGLLGNFDGNPDNDLQLRDGTAVPIRNQDIYGSYRNDWRVPLGDSESLFTQGTELFDPLFPSSFITLDSFDTDVRAAARQICIDNGVIDPQKLDACTLDVALTGDSGFAQIAKRADNTLPRINVSPASAVLVGGQSFDFKSSILADPTAKILWSASAGTIENLTASTIRYTAPSTIGRHTITATLDSDSSITTTIAIVVKSFSKSHALNSVVFFKDTYYRVYNENVTGFDAVYFEKSTDGKTWGSKTLISPKQSTINYTKAAIAVWERDGNTNIGIVFISVSSNLFRGSSLLYVQSQDNGLTFSNLRSVGTPTKVDKNNAPKLIVDSNKHLHIYWTFFGSVFGPNGIPYKGLTNSSEDNGQTWSGGRNLVTISSIGTVAVGTNSGDRWLVSSYFSKGIDVAYFNDGNEGSSGRIVPSNPNHRFSSLSPKLKFINGVLYATFLEQSSFGAPALPYISKSLDKGLTWSVPVRIPDESSEIPTLLSSANNQLMAIFVKRNQSGERESNIFMVTSNDEGITWSSSTQINSKAVNGDFSNLAVAIDNSNFSKMSLNYIERKPTPNSSSYTLIHNEFVSP